MFWVAGGSDPKGGPTVTAFGRKAVTGIPQAKLIPEQDNSFRSFPPKQ